MVPKLSLLIAVLAVVVLVFPTGAAQEQTRVAETTLNLGTNPFLSVGNTLARGGQTFGFVDYGFCHGVGGFNPQGATFEVTLEVTGAPDWLTVTMSDEPTQSFPLPLGPTTNEECPPNAIGDWEIVAQASDQAPYGEKATITATVTVAESGTSHTYQVPPGDSRTMAIEIESDPGNQIDTKLDNASRENPATTTTNNNGGGDTEESPPAPVAVFLIGFVLLGAFARRR